MVEAFGCKCDCTGGETSLFSSLKYCIISVALMISEYEILAYLLHERCFSAPLDFVFRFNGPCDKELVLM